MNALILSPRYQRAKRDGERGIALLVVLSTLTLLGSVVADFQFSSRVELQMALNARDELQAEYSALSALRMRMLLLRQSRQLEGLKQTMAGALGLPPTAMPPLGQILKMIPVECGLMSAIAKVTNFSSSTDDAEADFFPGECLATSSSEHAKISVNMLANTLNRRNEQVTRLLLGFLANPSLEKYFQEDDRNGTHAENALELVGAMTDWVDRDENQTGNQVADESRFYDRLKNSYEVKNAPFDSVAEVQLVHGVNDELYNVLKSNITVYSDSTQIELGAAPIERVLFGLLGAMREGSDVAALINNPGFGAFVQALAQLKQVGGTSFGVLNVGTLNTMLQTAGVANFFDDNLLKQVFTDSSGTTWYSLEAQGGLGSAQKRIRAVFQAGEGQIYYFRIE